MSRNRSVTATVYVVRGDTVLLHEHKKYHTWFPVGGHVEAGEFPHETALREVKEETGICVRLLETEVAPTLSLGRVDRVPAPFCLCHEGIGHEEEFFDFIFVAVTNEETPHPQAGESCVFKWFDRDELLTFDIKPHIRSTALAALAYAEEYARERGTLDVRTYSALPDEARDIRIEVFVKEQGFIEEFDGQDNDAIHFVLYDGEYAAATCRLFRTVGDASHTLGRLAVRREYRGKGLGAALLSRAEDYVRRVGGSAIVLHAQCAARPFYEKCGYSAYGGVDYEEDCPHVWMKKDVR